MAAQKRPRQPPRGHWCPFSCLQVPYVPWTPQILSSMDTKALPALCHFKTKPSRRISHLFPRFHLCSRFHSCVELCPELCFNTKRVTKLKGKTERDKCRQTHTGRGNCPAPVPVVKDFQVQLQSKSIMEWEILTSDERYGTFILEAHLLVHFTICVF